MFLIASFTSGLLGLLLCLVSMFLIVLILIQRGRGGGLTGALGGPGGQSAFGTKAGDIFTRITAITACIWIALCALTILLVGGTPLGGNIEPIGSTGTMLERSETTDRGLGNMGLPTNSTPPPASEPTGATNPGGATDGGAPPAGGQ